MKNTNPTSNSDGQPSANWKKPELRPLGKVSTLVLTSGGWWSCINHGDSLDTFDPGCQP